MTGSHEVDGSIPFSSTNLLVHPSIKSSNQAVLLGPAFFFGKEAPAPKKIPPE
jgi:hypothetical protein